MPLVETASSAEHLRDAVPGLAGITGFLLLPTLGAWLRLLLQILEWDRSGVGRPRRLSGLTIVKAVVLTMVSLFFMWATVRAAGELREIQIEAPVVGSSIRGLLVGLAFWAIYGVGISMLRSGARRRGMRQRLRGFR